VQLSQSRSTTYPLACPEEDHHCANNVTLPGKPLPIVGRKKPGNPMFMKIVSNSTIALLVCTGAVALIATPTLAAGAYHAPPAPVFRAPPAPVYIAPRVFTTPQVRVTPTPNVRPVLGAAKLAPRQGAGRTAVPRKQVALPLTIITTTPAVATTPTAKCTAKQVEVLARCKKP
jgi:hypothetical protein